MKTKKHTHHKPHLKLLITLVIIGLIGAGAGYFYYTSTAYQNKFNNLVAITEFSKTLEEYPQSDSPDQFDALYTTFYKKHYAISSFHTLMSYITFKKQPEWNASLCKHLLSSVTEQQTKSDFTGNYALRINTSPNARFILWGNIYGAFHSVIRAFQKLKELAIIDDQLKITKPDHYFIFTGNIINRSAYSLETLSLILRLMLNNQGKVFYTCGDHESEENLEKGIAQELQFKTNNIISKKDILSFFNTLPQALYLSIPGVQDQFVYIGHQQPSDRLQEIETQILPWLKQKTTQFITKGRLAGIASSRGDDTIQLAAGIHAFTTSGTQITTSGLSVDKDKKNLLCWKLLSCPTTVYQQFHNFMNDSFAILSANQTQNKWTIAHYTQNAKVKDGFKVTTHNFFESQQHKDSKTQSNEYTVGTTIDLSSATGEIGVGIQHGIKLRFNKENKNGGINGTLLNFTVHDHEYKPHIAVQKTEELIKNNINVVLAPVGTYTLKACIPLLQENKFIALSPVSISGIFEQLRNVIFFQATFENEAYALMHYAIKKLFLKRFVFFYQDDDFGRGAAQCAEQMAKKCGISPSDICRTSYPSNSVDVEKAADEIKKFNPAAIMSFSVANAAVALLSKFEAHWLATKIILGVHHLASNKFYTVAKQKGVSFATAHIIPDHKTSKLDIVKEFLEENKKTNTPPDEYSLQGYISASILIDVLHKIKKPITKEKIIETLESLQDYKFKGLILSMDKKTRKLNEDVWIKTPTNDWFYYPHCELDHAQPQESV